jgi:hypothetical protein
MLCVVSIEANATNGSVLARNFLHFLVSENYPPLRDELPGLLIFTPAASLVVKRRVE